MRKHTSASKKDLRALKDEMNVSSCHDGEAMMDRKIVKGTWVRIGE